MKRITTLLLCFCSASLIQAQIEVSVEPIIPYFVSQVIGDGTVVSDIQINGVDLNMINLQAGVFTDANEDIGLGAGLILGTGGVAMASDQNVGTGSSLPGAGADYSDSELEALSSVTVYDQIMLDFDFVALGDEVSMNYVFASEEYPEFGCSSFNDVIGVFITGPNPEGGSYEGLNIAWVPDPNDPDAYTDAPVAINTINDGMNGLASNCEELAPNYLDYTIYYVTNEVNTYEYDARTVVLPIRWPVVPGEVYHMKMGVGDGGDTAFDSAFLLQAQSFKTTAAEPNSIDEVDAQRLKLYPNPAQETLMVQTDDSSEQINYVEVLDISGTVVKLVDSRAVGSVEVSVAALPVGIYMLRVYTQDQVHTQRFTKH